MRPIEKMNVIQIEITNACIHQCANCTRFCGHHSQPFYMDLDTFKKAVDSMAGFNGMIGIMGGEPTLHPKFEQLLDYYATNILPREEIKPVLEPIRNLGEYIIENGLQDWTKKRGLWTSLGKKYYDNFEVIQDVFEFQLVNDHSNPGLHQSMLVSRKELGISDEEWLPLRDNCWVQNSWSASITPKGAFFCEVAAALDMLFNGPGGWPIEPGWWKRKPEEFGEQLNWCELCGACLNVPRIPANTEIDVVSPDLYKKLEEINSPKLKKGRVQVLNQLDQQKKGCSYSSEWYLPEGDNTKRISPSNSSLFPKHIDVISCNDNSTFSIPENAKDWVFICLQTIADNELNDFISLFKQWIFNPGCLYRFENPEILAFNVRAKAIRDYYPNCVNRLDQFTDLWKSPKVVRLKELNEPGDVTEKLSVLSQLEKQQTELMTSHILNLWNSLSQTRTKLVLFGCGQHSSWLLNLFQSHNLALPVLIIDDAPHINSLFSVPVISTIKFRPADFDALVISSDIHSAKMTETAFARWQKDITIINPYSHFKTPFFQKKF